MTDTVFWSSPVGTGVRPSGDIPQGRSCEAVGRDGVRQNYMYLRDGFWTRHTTGRTCCCFTSGAWARCPQLAMLPNAVSPKVRGLGSSVIHSFRCQGTLGLRLICKTLHQHLKPDTRGLHRPRVPCSEQKFDVSRATILRVVVSHSIRLFLTKFGTPNTSSSQS